MDADEVLVVASLARDAGIAEDPTTDAAGEFVVEVGGGDGGDCGDCCAGGAVVPDDGVTVDAGVVWVLVFEPADGGAEPELWVLVVAPAELVSELPVEEVPEGGAAELVSEPPVEEGSLLPGGGAAELPPESAVVLELPLPLSPGDVELLPPFELGGGVTDGSLDVVVLDPELVVVLSEPLLSVVDDDGGGSSDDGLLPDDDPPSDEVEFDPESDVGTNAVEHCCSMRTRFTSSTVIGVRLT